MDLDTAREFVRGNSNAVLTTLRKDGTPQMSPINVAVDGDGRFVISSRETAYKVKNLRRGPRAWLLVLNDAFYGQWVFLEGDVDIQSLPDAMEPLVDYYRTLSGEHPDWDDYRQAMVNERRVVLRITIDRAGPSRAG